MGGPPQPDFLNAVATGRTLLAPLELLRLLKRLEAEAGRLPSGEANGPRPLDLDLLLYGDRRIDLPELVVPHPRLAERRFVLAPLADLASRPRRPGHRPNRREPPRGGAARTRRATARGLPSDGQAGRSPAGGTGCGTARASKRSCSPAIVTRVKGGTDVVSQTLPPMTLPRPMTVVPPRIVAPA